MDRKQRGREAEQLAEEFLHRQRLRTVTRNYLCRSGEIDLIMLDGGELVFVEVRFRRSGNHGSAAESVDWRKQRKLIRAAEQFLLRHPGWRQHPCRFDVVAFNGSTATNGPLWYKDAFRL